MAGFDLNSASEIYLGGTMVSEVWLGQTKIWPSTPTHDYSADYFTINIEPGCRTANDYITCGINKWQSSSSFSVSLDYSTDNGTSWTTMNLNAGDTQNIVTENVEKILMRATRNAYGIQTSLDYTHFYINSVDTMHTVSGNIMSLLYGDNFSGQTSLPGNNIIKEFWGLFEDDEALLSAQNLILPATSLHDFCYADMFKGCYNLNYAPQLPATIGEAEGCYLGMFYGTNIREIELPATSLWWRCYETIFVGCTNLSKIKMMATSITPSRCLYHWIGETTVDLPSTGTFIMNASANYDPHNDADIPSTWTIQRHMHINVYLQDVLI